MARIAKIILIEGAQAVRLPGEYWFPGDEVRIARMGSSLLLSPIRREGAAPPDQKAIDAEVLRIFGQAPANDNELTTPAKASSE